MGQCIGCGGMREMGKKHGGWGEVLGEMGGVKKCVGAVHGVSVEGVGKSVGVRGSVKEVVGGVRQGVEKSVFLWGEVKGDGGRGMGGDVGECMG